MSVTTECDDVQTTVKLNLSDSSTKTRYLKFNLKNSIFLFLCFISYDFTFILNLMPATHVKKGGCSMFTIVIRHFYQYSVNIWEERALLDVLKVKFCPILRWYGFSCSTFLYCCVLHVLCHTFSMGGMSGLQARQSSMYLRSLSKVACCTGQHD